MFPVWVVFHVLVCIALVIVVLLQSSKGEGLAGSAFSGGLSSAVFGGRGAASFLSKATTVLAILFMLNCGALAYLSAKEHGVTMGGGETTATESAVTRQAQAEAARQQQQSQNPQGLPGGTQEATPVTTPPTQTTPPAGETGK